MSKYIYQRDGASIPLRNSRAADARALGGLQSTSRRGRVVSMGSLGDIVLPAPGAPEVMGGCGCGGKCGGMGDDAGSSKTSMAVSTVAWAALYYALGQKYPKMHWYQKLLIAGGGSFVVGKIADKAL